jgi:hypothetical protein
MLGISDIEQIVHDYIRQECLHFRFVIEFITHLCNNRKHSYVGPVQQICFRFK